MIPESIRISIYKAKYYTLTIIIQNQNQKHQILTLNSEVWTLRLLQDLRQRRDRNTSCSTVWLVVAGGFSKKGGALSNQRHI